MRKKITKRIVIFVLLSIVIFHAINNFIILINDKRPMDNGDVMIPIVTIKLYSFLSQGNYLEIITYTSNQLYLLPLLSVPFYLLFGLHKISFVTINIFFLVLLVFSVYKIGENLYSRKAGILSAFVVAFFPHVFGLSRISDFYFPLMCSLTFALYCLLKTNGFTSLKYSTYFGLAAGLSALLKTSFSVYLVAPFSIYLFNSFNYPLFKKKRLTYQKIKNLTVSFMAFLLLILPFYLFSFEALLNESKFGLSLADKTQPFFEIIKIYINNLMHIQILPFYFVLFILSLLLLLFFPIKNILFFLSWLFFPLIFFAFIGIGHTDIRFSVFMLPAIALIIPISIIKINNKIVRRILILSVIIIGFMQFFIISYHPNLSKYIGFSQEIIYSRHYYNRNFIGLLYSDDYEWEQSKILQLLNNSFDKKPKNRYNILSFPDHFHFPLQYALLMNNINQVDVYASGNLRTISLDGFDYVIISNIMNKNPDMPVYDNYINTNLNKKIYYKIINNFSLLGNITFPFNNVIISIYENKII